VPLRAAWYTVEVIRLATLTGFSPQRCVSYSAGSAYSIGDECLSGWMDVVKLFFKSLLLLLQFSSDSRETWRTWSTCKYGKNCGTDLRFFFVL